jgi:maltooligosyltrehalose trehalohydrolase
VNLGPTLRLGSIADPIVAPPRGAHWETLWSSEAPAYGGDGVGPVDTKDGWRVGGHQATVLRPPPASDEERSRGGGKDAC